MKKKKVVIGFLGPTLDRGLRKRRWNRWRPTVGVFQQDEIQVDRFEHLYQERFSTLRETIEDDIHRVSSSTLIRSHKVNFDNPWDFEEVYNKLFSWAKTYDFKINKEDYYFHITTGSHVMQICFFLLTESRYFPGQLIQSHPPKDRANDTRGTVSIIDLDLSKYDKISARLLQQQEYEIATLKSGIETKNKGFNKLIREIEYISLNSNSPLLISGSTGTGKSKLARSIFKIKKDNHQLTGDIVEVNCATLRGDSAMSTLFGHVKGAFTGAITSRKGLLLSANNGLLFLDEIGELGLDEQAMLLRAIEQGTFLPVGSDRSIKSSFQLIAATNRSLKDLVSMGQFREDLLARINLWEFKLPSLVERKEDILPNIYYELDRSSKDLARKIQFKDNALKKYIEFATSRHANWSANFRDLSSSISRMAILSPMGRIGVREVEDEIKKLEAKWSGPASEDSIVEKPIQSIINRVVQTKGALDTFEQLQLTSVLKICLSSKNLAEAGRKLFEVSRLSKSSKNDADRVRKYLNKYGISWQDLVDL